MSPFNPLFSLENVCHSHYTKQIGKKKKTFVWTCEYVYDTMLSKMFSNPHTIDIDWLVLVIDPCDSILTRLLCPPMSNITCL
jgi:hypothetical protein